MTPVARWRGGALVALAVGVALPFGVAHELRGRYQRALALQEATAVAGYIAVVTPRTRTGAAYDLPPLLIRARALDQLPEFSGRFEVYHATAPLVHATAPPLPTATLQRLRREVAAHWTGREALAPLLDHDGWAVVGAVAARPAGDEEPAPLWSVAALLLLGIAATQALRTIGGPRHAWRAALGPYGMVAALYGAAVFADLRSAARATTDRRLYDTRLLIQEAAARVPEVRGAPGDLAPIARGAQIVPGDSGSSAAWRRQAGGVTRAAVAVRFTSGRWVELRVPPAEAGVIVWLPLTLGCAALGPLAALLAGWSLTAEPEWRRETAAAWTFLAPSALLLAAFSAIPLLLALYVSVHGWSPIETARPFVGLANYVHVVRDPLTWSALGHTAVYALYVPIALALALGLAVTLGRHPRLTGFVSGVLLLPYVSSVVALALVWRWLYHPDLGVINQLLTRARLTPVDWLGNPKTALAALMVVAAWMQLGYQMTVFAAGLRAIPRVYLDAARVDGASAWQRFWRVTFPLLRPVTLFLLVTGMIGACQVFALVFVMTGGGPAHATDVIVTRIYRTAWELLQFGEASALALLLCALLLGATWSQLKLLDRRVEYDEG